MLATGIQGVSWLFWLNKAPIPNFKLQKWLNYTCQRKGLAAIIVSVQLAIYSSTRTEPGKNQSKLPLTYLPEFQLHFFKWKNKIFVTFWIILEVFRIVRNNKTSKPFRKFWVPTWNFNPLPQNLNMIFMFIFNKSINFLTFTSWCIASKDCSL